MPIDDVLDVVDTLFAADTYHSAGNAFKRTAELVANSGFGSLAKGSGPIGWGLRGLDAGVDYVGLELPPQIRDQLKAEAQQAKAGGLSGGLLPPNQQSETVTAGSEASDSAPTPPLAERAATGEFDP